MIFEYSYEPEFKLLFRDLKKLKHADELLELEGIGSQIDIAKFSKKFFRKNTSLTTADVSVDSNSNVDDVNTVQYMVEVSKPLHRLNALYLLWKYARTIFSDEVATKIVTAQLNKEIYINDLHTFGLLPYCFNYSCMDIVFNGLSFVNKIKSGPPKHLSSYVGQVIQFVIYAANSTVGAVGLADFLICASHYVERMYKETRSYILDEELVEKIVWKQVRQELQSFVYSVNQPSRNGQSPFTNISIFDDPFLGKLCSEYVFPDGTKPNGELIERMQILFMDMMNGILRETPATFPVTTVCFAVDAERNILDQKFLDLVIEKNEEFAFMNIYAGAQSTLSSCCRLRSEGDNEYFNMFGSGGTKIGSIGVATLNLPRIAYTAESEEDFFKKLEERVMMIAQINHVKRHILQKRIDNNNAPLYTLGIMSIKKQYSTTGLVGINEVTEIMGLDILKEAGQELIVKVLQTVNRVNDRAQRRFKTPHNAEQVPAESSAVALANADRLLGYNKKYALYSNQFIPLTVECDILDRIKLQGMFDGYMSGGAICHLNFSERVTDREFIKKLLIKSIKLGTVYQAINYNIQRCKKEHMSVGINEKCPICGADIVDNFTRVVGFLIPVKNWHKTRRELDYTNRQWYGKETKS